MQVNPMSEIRAIAEACRRECLPASARLLWRVLFDCANDRRKFNPSTNTYDWPDDFFPIDNAELILNSALEKRALLEARNRLKQIGAIDFKPGENNRRPARYRIIYLTGCRYKNAPADVPAQAPAQVPAIAPAPVPAHVPIYHKDIETDEIKNICEEDVVEDVDIRAREAAIRSGFGRFFGRVPFPAEVENLSSAGLAMGFSAEMVVKAIECAAKNGARNPVGLTTSILEEWRAEEVKQPHQVDEYRAQKDMLTGRSAFSGEFDDELRRAQEAREQRRAENRRDGPAAQNL